MKSKCRKVLHEAAGRSMLEWVVNAVRGGYQKCTVVCGRGMDKARLGGAAAYGNRKSGGAAEHAVMRGAGLENF